MITFAKGATSGYLPLGGVITRSGIAQPFLESGGMFTHGITFGGHPVSCAVALANLEIMQSERIVEHVAEHESYFRAGLESLSDIPIVKEVRGAGYFFAIELMKDPVGMIPFSDQEGAALVTDVLKPALRRHRMLARADNRGAPVLQFSPPLVAGTEEIDVMVDTSRAVLEEAAKAAG